MRSIIESRDKGERERERERNVVLIVCTQLKTTSQSVSKKGSNGNRSKKNVVLMVWTKVKEREKCSPDSLDKGERDREKWSPDRERNGVLIVFLLSILLAQCYALLWIK